MDGLRIILIAVAVIIIIVNLIINLSNLTRITIYCFQTNTLDQYWPTFFKSGLSGRAIISSIFGIIMALALFIIILPFILIRRAISGKKTARQDDELLMTYTEKDLSGKQKTFITNITETGLNEPKHVVTGKFRVDATMILAELVEQSKENNKQFEYKIGHKVKLDEEREGTIPMLFTIDNREYPVYFLYDQKNYDDFSKIQNLLYYAGFKKCLYFSLSPVSRPVNYQ